jgi:hypothetical protein
MLRCPSCAAAAISLEARKRLLWRIHCPACKSSLRLKWGGWLVFGYLSAVTLLFMGAVANFPGLHAFRGAAVIMGSLCLILATRIGRRLPLEPA